MLIACIEELAHDCNGCFAGHHGHAVLHQIEHVLVVEKPDEMEGAKGGSATQGQVADHHRTVMPK